LVLGFVGNDEGDGLRCANVMLGHVDEARVTDVGHHLFVFRRGVPLVGTLALND
jgi:hypothetical protein